MHVQRIPMPVIQHGYDAGEEESDLNKGPKKKLPPSLSREGDRSVNYERE